MAVNKIDISSSNKVDIFVFWCYNYKKKDTKEC